MKNIRTLMAIGLMVGAIAVAGYFGINPPDFAAGTVAIAFGLAASSFDFEKHRKS